MSTAAKSVEKFQEQNRDQSVSQSIEHPEMPVSHPECKVYVVKLGQQSFVCVHRDSNMERFSIFHDLVRTFLNLTSVTHSRCSCKRDVLWGSLFLELSLQFHAHVVCCRFDERRFDAGWKLE